MPACIQMTLRYHNIEANQEDLTEQLRTSSVTGTEYIDIASVSTPIYFIKKPYQMIRNPVTVYRTLTVMKHQKKFLIYFKKE